MGSVEDKCSGEREGEVSNSISIDFSLLFKFNPFSFLIYPFFSNILANYTLSSYTLSRKNLTI